MFLQYYGMREHPFGVTPDPRYLYLSPTHREALASLIYGVEAGRGFMGLIAQPGMGKTTLLFQLLELLGSSARTVFLFHTECDSREFLHYLLSDMGIDSQGEDLARMHDKLNQVLLAEAQSGRRFVVVIDEAQNLAEPVLETVRLLSNFETRRSKLMQIILAGQPQLAKKLALPGLAQLRQRISLFARLEPFDPAETRSYIDYRLKVAGYEGPPLFTADAMGMIAEQGEGIPRNINNLCFNALSLGFALRKKKIDATIVQEVLSDLDVNTLTEETVSGTLEAQPAVQRTAAKAPYRSTRLADRLRSVLWVGAPVTIVLVTAFFLLFFRERARFGEHLSQPQKASASNSTQLSPPVRGRIKTDPTPSVNAEAHPAEEVPGQGSGAKTDQPSSVSVGPTAGTVPAEPDRSAQFTHPLPSVQKAPPTYSKAAHARSPVQRYQKATTRNGAQQRLRARTVLPDLPTPLSSSSRPPHVAAAGSADSGDGSAPEAALSDFKTYRLAVEQSPGDPAAHHNLARALQNEGDLDRAVAEYREALRLAPIRAESHIGLGGVLFEKRDFDGALAEFRAAARLKPDDSRAHYNAGLVLYARGDPASIGTAVSEYREAIRLHPVDADAHYALGIALFQKGDVDAAISEYRECLRLAPDRALVHEQLGRALLQKGERSAAVKELKTASRPQ
jgi:general secretion pathway protein A